MHKAPPEIAGMMPENSGNQMYVGEAMFHDSIFCSPIRIDARINGHARINGFAVVQGQASLPEIEQSAEGLTADV
jgi:hypothetical protein